MSRSEAPYLALTLEVIAEHLRRDHHIGFYPLGDDDTCWWVAADFDKDSAMLDALAYLKAARAYGIPAAFLQVVNVPSHRRTDLRSGVSRSSVKWVEQKFAGSASVRITDDSTKDAHKEDL